MSLHIIIVAISILLTALPIIVYRFVQVKTTTFMLIRKKEYKKEGKSTEYQHIYIPIEKLPNHLIESVIIAEDPRYLKHHGICIFAIHRAIKHNMEVKDSLWGGSSITQQIVKNVFLWPARSWLRKIIESYYAILLDAIWGKKYQMEVYLNSIEMGENIYGIEAAARHYYDKSASELTEEESADISVILPNPRRISPLNLPESLLKRQKDLIRTVHHVNSYGGFNKAKWGF